MPEKEILGISKPRRLAKVRPNACHSITKSSAGTLAAAFVHKDVLDEKRFRTSYPSCAARRGTMPRFAK